MRPLRGDEGQAAMLVAVMLLGFVVMLGLVADGGAVLAARRDLQDLADAAARAGAAAISQPGFRQPGSQEVVLDEPAAESAALRYLAQVGYRGDVEVRTGPQLVEVRLERAHSITFGRLLGTSSVAVHADAVAAPASRGAE